MAESPRQHGLAQTRWRLSDVRQAVPWLAGRSTACVSTLLGRLGFSRQAAQRFSRSPDLHYDEKWRAVLQAVIEAVLYPERVVLLFMDELTYYRQPSLAPAFQPRASGQPRAWGAARANTQTRVVAALQILSGQLHYAQRSAVTSKVLCNFYAQLRQAYPAVSKVYLVQDNWPPHHSPPVLACAAGLGLSVLFLPTYASWLNPIEKLWRWLKQAVLHLHPHAADLESLRQQVCAFLDQFAHGSPALLRYVGLSVD